jgi:tryptophanyl-tRNA synthetase
MILFERINAMLEPFREKRAQIESKSGYIEDVLHAGEKRAHEVAEKTMHEIRKAMGFLF